MKLPLKQFLVVIASLFSIPIIVLIFLLVPYLSPQIYDRSMSYFFGTCPAEHSETHTILQLNGQTLAIPTDLVQRCILFGRKALDDERHVILSGKFSRLLDVVSDELGNDFLINSGASFPDATVFIEIQPSSSHQTESLTDFQFECDMRQHGGQICIHRLFEFSRRNTATITIFATHNDDISYYSEGIFLFLLEISK